MLIVWFFVYKKLAQFAVRCALPPRRSESPVCATDNKPSCVLHLLGWFIGSRGFSSLERRPEFWLLQYQTLRFPRNYSLQGFSVHGIPQIRILEWAVISFSGESRRLRDWTWISCIAGRFYTTEPPGRAKPTEIWHRNFSPLAKIQGNTKVKDHGQYKDIRN